jgi:hypothetical protein
MPLVGIQDGLGGCQLGKVDVVDVADDPCEITKVIPLGKTGELRDIVEPNIHKESHARGLQLSKKYFRRLLGEAYGKKFHLFLPLFSLE